MFEHRLGLALHKSLGEVRSLPYPEYHSWELFYLLEPWGFADEEYRTAALLTMLYNINRAKGKGRGKGKEVKDFMRDMAKELLRQLKAKTQPDLSAVPREQLIEMIKKDFGIR